MSTNRWRLNPVEVPEGTDEAHSPSPRKKPRLSSAIEVERKAERVNPDVIRDGIYKPTSAPTQPFRLHHGLNFVSEGARPSKRNKRAISGQRRPRRMTTVPSPNSFPYSGPPEQFDVTPGLLDAIPLADGESSCWATEHVAFIKSTAGLDNAHWTGTRPLGSGTFGTAGLWELRDENNAVTEVSLRSPARSM